MKIYVKGDNYKDPKNDYWTYGITEFDMNAVLDSDKEHAQKIEVYGDENLRNEIIGLLNERTEPKNTLNNCHTWTSGNEIYDEEAPCQSEPDIPSIDIKTSSFEQFQKALENLINEHNMESGSNTPDFILAEYLVNCLKAFNVTSRDREKWYGKSLKI